MIKIKLNKVYFNTAFLGIIERDVDGFFHFWIDTSGSWSSYSLRLIADKLDRVNKRWNDHINEYFKKQENDTTGTTEIYF